MPTNVRLVKAMVLPVVIYGCDSYTIKKAEHQRIHAFELCCWRRLLRIPWTAKRSNQSIVKEVIPKYSLEGLMLKLKLQYFRHLMQRTGKDPDAGKDWRWEEKGMTEDEMVGWYHRLDGHGFGWTPGVQGVLAWWTGRHGMLQFMRSQRVGYNWATELNHTIALISCASKVMLKILQARLQHYVNEELPDVQDGFSKGRGPEITLPTSAGSSKKQQSSRKTYTSASLTMLKSLTVWITTNCGKFFKRCEYQTTWPASWEICVQVKNNS